ncbi:TPA: hypothetical protein I7753_21485 [Vibrio vulnificus]|nr:hypothetical protein [Vibrio vulnificus]EKG2506480.1 hypothetical protein [Vibrio vulnificus]ELK5320616.1 hypothetical protein [Vibrio vulnificus]HAS8389621.1 hypothetical protein [Vibrio vulnificus]HAS8484031.1 hypothetical protein [Vibrio vulnificus]
MKHYFQLTYSVRPLSDDSKDKRAAEKARKLIRENLKWESISKIETTLVGEISIRRSDLDEMRYEAKELIDDEIRDMLKENEVFDDIRVNLSLMVDGLGQHIEFSM